ncbi:MAG: hypothetical protein RL236_811 [Pseudomonadota bacterium]|jgi:hypothetical protein
MWQQPHGDIESHNLSVTELCVLFVNYFFMVNLIVQNHLMVLVLCKRNIQRIYPVQQTELPSVKLVLQSLI